MQTDTTHPGDGEMMPAASDSPAPKSRTADASKHSDKKDIAAATREALAKEIEELIVNTPRETIIDYALQTIVKPAEFKAIVDSGELPWKGCRITYDYQEQRVVLRRMPSQLHEAPIKFFEEALKEQLRMLGVVNHGQYEMHTNLDYYWDGGMVVPDLSVYPVIYPVMEAGTEGYNVYGSLKELVGPTWVLESAYSERNTHVRAKVAKWMRAAPMLQSVVIIIIGQTISVLPSSSRRARQLVVEVYCRQGQEAVLASRFDLTDYTQPAPSFCLPVRQLLGPHSTTDVQDRVLEVDLAACRDNALSRTCWWA